MDTGRPASRSSWTKPWSTSSIAGSDVATLIASPDSGAGPCFFSA